MYQCMNFIMITLKTNMIIKDYCPLIQTGCCIILKLKMFIKILVRIEKFFILEISQLSQNVMIQAN